MRITLSLFAFSLSKDYINIVLLQLERRHTTIKLTRFQSTIYLRMYLSELFVCDKRRFKRLNMALMIQKG